MKIDTSFAPIPPIENPFTQSGNSSEFVGFLEKSMGDVNSLLNESDKQSENMVLGKVENLHDSMITMQKAETSLKLMMQIRNKAIEAYQQIMQMQI